MATRSTSESLLVNGYIREIDSSSTDTPKEINDLIFLFFFVVIGSEMLTNNEEKQLIEWIDDSNKCDFKLLFKATRDGFGSAEFHKKCDGNGANISIIKSEQQFIFGGYTSKSWNNNGDWTSDKFAWLYSLRNKKGIKQKFNGKNEHWAMYGGNDDGPMYGDGDLLISNNCNENEYSYTKLGCCYEGESDPLQLNDGTFRFKVLDYEIWQIVKK